MARTYIKWLFMHLLFIPFAMYAMNWEIIPKESEIKFTAIQNEAPVSGQFKNFTGEIRFDPEHLSSSQVRIIVNINSISAAYAELVDALVTRDWFDVKVFPTAIFQSNQFTKIDAKTFEADGTLTIRNQTKPLKLRFNILKETPDKVTIGGNTVIKRNDFGIGQGEWAATNEIRDEVKVAFIVTATKK